jgi:folate-binding protein YgfZ
MSAKFTILPERGVVAVTGEDARKLLQDLITNDMDTLVRAGDALHAALLSPQGKILFEFFVLQTEGGFLLETAREKTADLVKRLTMYKLRANAEIADRSDQYIVAVDWSDAATSERIGAALRYRDPRRPELAERCLLTPAEAPDANTTTSAHDDYARRRVALGVPDPQADYALGDAFPHEANFDRLDGISFTKGCFVGQEVASRTQNKSVVRKRIVKISSVETLAPGSDIALGSAVIGKVGTVAGNEALAMLRLDRAAEAQDKGQSLSAAGIAVTVDPASLAAYRKSVVDRPIVDL